MSVEASDQVFAILFRVEAKSGKEKALAEFFKWNADVSLNEERGTLRFDVLEDLTTNRAFFVYEVYASRAAFKRHKGNGPYKKWKSPAFQAEVVADLGFCKMFEGSPLRFSTHKE